MACDRKTTLLGVIHCAATPPHMDIGAAEIHRWHYKRGIYSPRGFTGYHAVIRRDGTLELGRQPLEMGAHARGHNAVSVSVCLVGGVAEDATTPEDNFTVPQWNTLKRVVDYWWAIWPGIPVCGHRDLGAPKACPSFDVEEWMLVHYGETVASQNGAAVSEYLDDYRSRRDS